MAALSPKTEKRSQFLGKFNTREGIAAEVRRHGSQHDMLRKFLTLNAGAAPHQKHFVANDQFGGLLHQFAQKLDQMSVEQQGETRERLFVSSNVHEMEIEIQCKIEDNKDSPNYGKSYFTVGLTGLNEVNEYSRVFVSNPEDLKKLTLLDFVPGETSSHVAVTNISPEIDVNLNSMHFAENTKSAVGVWAGLVAAAHSNMPEVFDFISNNHSGKVSDAQGQMQRHALLQGKDCNNNSIIHNLMNNDLYAPSVIAYANLISKNKENLPPLADVNLLIEANVDKKTGQKFDALTCAIHAKQPGVINALHEAFISLNPSERGKKLICESVERALQFCVESGECAEVYKATLEIMKTFSPSSEKFMQELYGFSEEGGSAVAQMAENGDSALLEEYFGAVKKLRLAEPETQDSDDKNSFENNQSILMDMLGRGNESEGMMSAITVCLKGFESDETKLKIVQLMCENLTSCGLTPKNAVEFLRPVLEDAVMSGVSNEVLDVLKAVMAEQQILSQAVA
jgi:hypothetical protein